MVRQDAIALKSLELARSEILERIKLGYQTLIVYAASVGGIGAWWLGKTEVQAKVPIGVIVGFLAVVASWMTYDNEHMIKTLARYQRETLSGHFKTALSELKLWESSKQLEAVLKSWHRYIHIFTQQAVVFLPAIYATYLQWSMRHLSWDIGAIIFLAFAIGILVEMLCDWRGNNL